MDTEGISHPLLEHLNLSCKYNISFVHISCRPTKHMCLHRAGHIMELQESKRDGFGVEINSGFHRVAPLPLDSNWNLDKKILEGV